MNPNHRMPVLVDHDPRAARADRDFRIRRDHDVHRGKGRQILAAADPAEYEVAEWVIWQMANQGPKLGECGHFRRLGDKQGDQSYAVRRFTDEATGCTGC